MSKQFEFPVTIYGNLEKYNDTLSKARCRIFYKYKNRNGTFITDEFANKLLSSVAYAPVKGIFSSEEGDYTDHGEERDEGRIYGIVPENPNVAWEDHLDEDGKVRTYACVDVLIFTALYEEAREIVGKSQSMELYGPTLQYHQGVIDGQKVIVFDDGCFLGLQVLGDNTEPCFEGASFYSLQSQIENIIYQLKAGGTTMPKFNFKLSDNEKYQAIWSLLNNEFNEESGWIVTYSITDVYDDYALVYSYEDGHYYRAYYTKDENDMVEISEKKRCHVLDVTDEEKATLDTLRKLNGDTYELVSETLVNAEKTSEENSEFVVKIEEMESSISTLEQEKDGLTTQIDEYATQIAERNETIESLNNEINDLKAYKLNVETMQKESVISEYANQLQDEVLDNYRAKFEELSVEELDMHLAYELKKSNGSIFAKDNNTGFTPKQEQNESGVIAILRKQKSK